MHSATAGFSFVELLITSAIVALVFGGLFAAVQAMVILINDSKAKAGATALVTERMEYIRSLEYNAVGTIGAPPFGAIPQNRIVTLNNINYSERVVIRYEDDPADGTGFGPSGDGNGIINDYKKIKIEYSWPSRNGTSSISLSTTVVPQGIETSAGGGSIRVYINDAAVNPVPNAQVTITNTTLATTTNTTQTAGTNGEFVLSGLPAGGGYSISVTRPGYSIDGTSIATGMLSSPNQPIVSVAESAVTTQFFQIDAVSDVTITTVGVPLFGTFADTFTSAVSVATTTQTVVGGGEVVLQDVAGVYMAAGTLMATTSSPSPLVRWYAARFDATVSASTSVALQLYHDDGGGLVLVPDSDLPGNSTGFMASPINLTGLDAGVYDDLALAAVLTTSDSAVTPTLFDWELQHVESQPNVSGVPITVQGAKSLGTDASSAPVLKFDNTFTTDGSGELTLTDIEYDVYTVTVDDPALDVLEACPSNPLLVAPGTSAAMQLTLANISGSFLRVTVTDPANVAIDGADVRLENAGYDTTQTTNLCGQTYFSGGGLYDASGYIVTVTKPGFSPTVVNTGVTSTSSVTIQIST